MRKVTPFESRSALARKMYEQVATLLPHRRIQVCADGEYATRVFLQHRPANVEVVSRFLISGQLYDKPQPSWSDGEKILFALSSPIQNKNPSLIVLKNQKWHLPRSGNSHLYVHADHPDVMNEFSHLLCHLSERTDALLDLVGKVSLDMYITRSFS